VRGADAAGTHTHLLQECAGQPGYEWAVVIKGGLLRNFWLVVGWNPADLLFYEGLFVKNDVKKFSDAGCNSDSTCGQKAENLGLSMQIDSATVALQCLQDSNGALVVTFVATSVACAAILFGAALYPDVTKMKNKTSSEYRAGKAKVMTEGAQKKSEEREDAAGKIGRKSNDKNHRVRVSEEVAGAQGVCTDTPAKTGMIST
jgi:hypothetical protein